MAISTFIVVLLVIVSAIHLVNEALDWDKHKMVKSITKPMLLPLIILYYTLETSTISNLILIGLIFGFLGDVFLLDKKSELRFMGGLVSFLLGHVLYIVHFFKISFPGEGYIGQLVIIIIVYSVYILIFFTKLRPSLKEADMEIPVIVYSIVLALMGISAFLVMKTNVPFFFSNGTAVYIGSIFFLISDSILAWDVFKKEIPRIHVIIMATYILAQFLIAYGMIN